jgi:hypothetical protein
LSALHTRSSDLNVVEASTWTAGTGHSRGRWGAGADALLDGPGMHVLAVDHRPDGLIVTIEAHLT